MFTLSSSPDALEEFINPLTTVTTEARLHFTDSTISSTMPDPANVAMVDVVLNIDGLKQYSFSGEEGEELTIGVDLDKLENVISMADSDDIVTITYSETNRRLEIDAGGIEYNLALISPDAIRAEPEIPELGLPVETTMEAGSINQAITVTDMVADQMKWECSGDTIMSYAEGDTDTANADLATVDEPQDPPVSSTFSLEYMKGVKKTLSNDTEVEMLLGEDMPVKLSWSFAGGQGAVLYMLAPRIDS